MISNDRYEITVTGNTLTVKAKKTYGDLPAGQAYDYVIFQPNFSDRPDLSGQSGNN